MALPVFLLANAPPESESVFSGYWGVALVTIIIWVGILLFLFHLDKRIRRIERELKGNKQ